MKKGDYVKRKIWNLKFETKSLLEPRGESDRVILRCHPEQQKKKVLVLGGIKQIGNRWKEK